MIKFTTETETYTPIKLTIQSNCNDITFVNSATATVFISGFPIAIGGTLVISGNENEINVTTYNLSFNGGTGSVYVIRKKYIS